jgi:hypothetical protein
MNTKNTARRPRPLPKPRPDAKGDVKVLIVSASGTVTTVYI